MFQQQSSPVQQSSPGLQQSTPTALERVDVEWADLVVTMGRGDACPPLPGKEYVDWNLRDPAGLCLEEVRELRSVIEQRVSSLPL